MNTPDEVIEAAVPWIDNFLERRGIALRGKEAQALASYVLQAAAPHLMAQAWDEGADAVLEDWRGAINPYRPAGD